MFLEKKDSRVDHEGSLAHNEVQVTLIFALDLFGWVACCVGIQAILLCAKRGKGVLTIRNLNLKAKKMAKDREKYKEASEVVNQIREPSIESEDISSDITSSSWSDSEPNTYV